MDFVLAQVLKDGQGATIAEKVERAGEILGFISRLPSGIEREHYLKKTAEALDVDEAVLRQEMAQQRTAAAGPRERTAPGPGRACRRSGPGPRRSWSISCCATMPLPGALPSA